MVEKFESGSDALVTIRVRLFAAARDLARSDQIELQLPAPLTIGDVRRALVETVPELARLIPYARFAVDSEYAPENTPVSPDAEIACIPPVSGG